ANGLKKNTVILYLADNGWDANNRMWESRRAKLSPYERGIRTPIMIRWPDQVAPAMDQLTLAHVTDLPKTILDITGAKNPGDLPGLNLMDREAMKNRETVFVEAYTHDMADLSAPEKSLFAKVVIHDWWKLIIPGPATPDRPFATAPQGTELYNLEDDPYETNNLADEHPAIVAKLKKLQKAHWNPEKPACCEGH
ncbi:MAG TPA: sulfatase/phosphatase domain-containing protein, partial [Opitutales bacterium]|nr:sulfatase/phosphatase domain-containing protein [Opitutales bacterium]